MMLNQQTYEKLSWIHLPAMAREFRRQSEDPSCGELTFDERFGMAVDAEWSARQNKVLTNLIKRAQFNPGFDRRSVKTVKITPETRSYQ
jgi:hypothetical protein